LSYTNQYNRLTLLDIEVKEERNRSSIPQATENSNTALECITQYNRSLSLL